MTQKKTGLYDINRFVLVQFLPVNFNSVQSQNYYFKDKMEKKQKKNYQMDRQKIIIYQHHKKLSIKILEMDIDEFKPVS